MGHICLLSYEFVYLLEYVQIVHLFIRWRVKWESGQPIGGRLGQRQRLVLAMTAMMTKSSTPSTRSTCRKHPFIQWTCL